MNASSKKFLSNLINSISPSGYEGPAAKFGKMSELLQIRFGLIPMASSHAIVNMGGGPRVMLAGHCDEIGFQVSYIDKSGFIWIQPVGGWDAQIATGQRIQVLTKKVLLKVIGKMAIHSSNTEQRRSFEIKDLWLDIGAKSEKDASKLWKLEILQ